MSKLRAWHDRHKKYPFWLIADYYFMYRRPPYSQGRVSAFLRSRREAIFTWTQAKKAS